MPLILIPHQVTRWTWGTLFAGLSVLSGCSKSDSNPSNEADSAQRLAGTNPAESSGAQNPPLGTQAKGAPEDAKQLLEESLRVYRDANKYSDQAQLTISVPGTAPFSSPFRVAFERPNRLAISAHGARGCWTSTNWEAICSGPTNPFPNQRLVRPLPETIDLDWLQQDNLGGLFADPVGMPIQIELLLSRGSLSELTGADTKIAFLKPETVDGRVCDRVQIDKSNLRWILGIDRDLKTLRTMDLPPQFFYPGQSAEELKGVSCTIDIISPKIDQAIDWSEWQVPTRAEDISVRRFVMPPPIASTKILGEVIPPFDLNDSRGERLLDSAEPKRPISILCWIGEDPASEAFTKDLLKIQKVLVDQELAPQCQIFLVGRETAKSLPEAIKKWNCDLPLAVDRTGISDSLFKIPSEPSIVVMDRNRRVQVSEYVITPATVSAIPNLVKRLIAEEDLASRQLQQDADNQARYIGALHRVAIDKEQAAKLPAIREFQFSLHGMRRDWKAEFADPILSAGGIWYPEHTSASGNSERKLPYQGQSNLPVMSVLDDTGKLYVVDEFGRRHSIGSIESEQADGAKRIHTSIDPWSHSWVAVIPEGLPRFWIAPIPTPLPATVPAVNATQSSNAATTYNTQIGESPNAFVWTSLAKESSLVLASDQSRLLVINPKNEQRKDGILNESLVSIAPGLDANGQVAEWNAVGQKGHLTRIGNLANAASGSLNDQPIEARLNQLPTRPEPGVWLWGKHGNLPITISLTRLLTGETGIQISNPAYQPIIHRPLTVRPEQSRLLGATRLADGNLYGIATGPNRILHLFTGDLRIVDQVSFDSRILAASIVPFQQDLRLIVALENEVSCWTIDVPDARGTTASPASNETPSPSDSKPAASGI